MAAAIAIAGCVASSPEAGAPDSVRQVADRVLRALAAEDWEALAAHVHPEKGVRFSPYAHVEPAHLTFDREELVEAARAARTRVWGVWDGTGDPIELSFEAYHERFIYSHPFLDADTVALDSRVGSGNSIHNIPEAYPEAVFVEYHREPSDPEFGGLDWASLRLVLEAHDGEWYLVGVVHDEWTI